MIGPSETRLPEEAIAGWEAGARRIDSEQPEIWGTAVSPVGGGFSKMMREAR